MEIARILELAWEHAFPGREAAERNAILRELTPPMQREARGPSSRFRPAPKTGPACGDARELWTQRLETRRCIPGLCVHRGPDATLRRTYARAYDALKAQFTEEEQRPEANSALSRRKQGFESPRERQYRFVRSDSLTVFGVLPKPD